LRRLLKDPDSWDALDKASGHNLEVFAIRDVEEYGSDTNDYLELVTAASISRAKDRGYYFSKLLHDYFGVEKTRLPYPSFLLFIVENRRVRKCWLIPFHRATVETSLNWLVDLFSSISKGLSDAGGAAAPSEAVYTRLKELLLDRKYTLYIQSAPPDAERAVRVLTEYVEGP
jgi:hypothetical protein